MTPLAFLNLLYKGATAQGFIEFRFLKGGTRHWLAWPTFEEAPDAFTPDLVPAGRDAYWGVAIRREQGTGPGIGGRENCRPTRLVWVDIDLIDHPEVTGGLTKDSLLQTSAEELAEYKAALQGQVVEHALSLNLPPRAIVDSGHGLQVYWARRIATDHDDTERFNRGLVEAFGGDTKSTDAARILRVPGTENRKNPQRPLPVQVVYSDADAWVEDGDLPVPTPPVKASPAPRPLDSEPDFKSFDATAEAKSWTLQQRYAQTALAREIDQLRATGEGGRNDQLNVAAFSLGTLVGAGILDEAQAIQELTDAAQAIGLEADEIRDTVRSGLAGGKQKPRDLSTIGQRPPSAGRGTIGKHDGQVDTTHPAVSDVLASLPDDKAPNLGQYRDLVLAEFHESGLVYRYHQVWRSWWMYQDGVYVEMPDEVMAQKVDLTLQAHGFTLKNAQITEVLVKIGRDALIGSRTVDQGAWELNTRTGVLDLDSGQLYEHTPDYFSIIQSTAHYRPGAIPHDWLAFLRQAVPSESDRQLLQMFAGLCLTGDTSPQKALLLIGDGGTGKGTFTRVLSAVLGNLSTSSAIENIKDGSFLVGTLVGKRMCTVSELPRSFDWLPFKRITGEDSISIDVKNKTPYTAKLDMKLVILSNVMPFLGDDTSNSSLMRRFLPVAFNIKPETTDPDLEARLTHLDELPGVLNWMLEGLAMLRAARMRFPSSDTADLAREIVEESNRVVTFLRDECTYVPAAQTGSTELYTAYRKWCSETGHKALSSISFGKQLIAAGKHFGKPIDRFKDRLGRGYVNLTVSTAPGGWEDEA